jgi:hypothetical protein
MWWDVVIDVLWPSEGPGSVEHSVEKGDGSTIAVQFRVPGAFTRGLNESGWLADDVVAAGVLRQGKGPSPLGAVTGLTLIEMARPRRSKSLPREFVLAATADRVVAFAISSQEEGMTPVIKVKRGERGSWPRELVRLIDPIKGIFTRGGTLELAGLPRFPVTSDGDDSTDELIELLKR